MLAVILCPVVARAAEAAGVDLPPGTATFSITSSSSGYVSAGNYYVPNTIVDAEHQAVPPGSALYANIGRR